MGVNKERNRGEGKAYNVGHRVTVPREPMSGSSPRPFRLEESINVMLEVVELTTHSRPARIPRRLEPLAKLCLLSAHIYRRGLGRYPQPISPRI